MSDKTDRQREGIRPRPRADLPSMVSDFIRDQILKGELAPGDKLPTERELSEIHNVSRVVIREGVAHLKHEGLAVSRQGLGVFVASPADSNFLSLTKDALSKPTDYRHLYHLRNILESGAAKLAAEQHDVQDLTLLEDQLRAMQAESAYKDAYVDADIGFHRAVAAATKNPFIVVFNSFVDSKLKASISLALQTLDFASTVEVSVAEHMEIFERIKARDPDGAEAAMRVHLENSSRRLGL